VTLAAFSKDPARGACAQSCVKCKHGSANEVIGDLPTRQSLFDKLPNSNAVLRSAQGVPRPRPGAAGVPIYPRSPIRSRSDGRGPVRFQEPEDALDGAWKPVMAAYKKM